MALHESAHIFAARTLGAKPEGISLDLVAGTGKAAYTGRLKDVDDAMVSVVGAVAQAKHYHGLGIWRQYMSAHDSRDLLETAAKMGASDAEEFGDRAANRAAQFVSAHWSNIRAIAARLLEKGGQLTGAEIESALAPRRAKASAFGSGERTGKLAEPIRVYKQRHGRLPVDFNSQ